MARWKGGESWKRLSLALLLLFVLIPVFAAARGEEIARVRLVEALGSAGRSAQVTIQADRGCALSFWAEVDLPSGSRSEQPQAARRMVIEARQEGVVVASSTCDPLDITTTALPSCAGDGITRGKIGGCSLQLRQGGETVIEARLEEPEPAGIIRSYDLIVRR